MVEERCETLYSSGERRVRFCPRDHRNVCSFVVVMTIQIVWSSLSTSSNSNAATEAALVRYGVKLESIGVDSHLVQVAIVQWNRPLPWIDIEGDDSRR